MPGGQSAGSWDVLIPVKDLGRAKSRLSLGDVNLRQHLVVAFAADVASAAARCPRVQRIAMVGPERRLPGTPRGLVRWIPEPADSGMASGPDGERTLNSAVSSGARILMSECEPRFLAVVASDLPALRTVTLARLMEHFADLAARGKAASAFVADARGTGTTILVVAPGVAPRPRFGRASASRHADEAMFDITAIADAGARTDVDRLADLRLATALGVGRETALTLARGVPQGRMPAPSFE